MYAGTTLRPMRRFDAWFGAHQKIDRVAHTNLSRLTRSGAYFPSKRQIIRFEGLDGPDGIKRKTPGRDEPWHYYDPSDPSDNQLVQLIDSHYTRLVAALTERNDARASFEAAWLAHAIVDGLTPAHHYPYEQELTTLRGGAGLDTRDSVKDKLIMPGETISKQVRNNWKMWGDRGLLATHFAFEWGIAAMILPLRLRRSAPTEADLETIRRHGVGGTFRRRARTIAGLKMYETFYKSGWTPKLSKVARRELIPLIINTVSLAWYQASLDAQQAGKS